MSEISDPTRGLNDERPLVRAFVLALPLLLVIGAGLWFALGYIQPPPQRVVVITTGAEGGGYDLFGQAYKARLEAAGIKTQLLNSKGAIENLARISDRSSGVTIALMQGGVGKGSAAPGVVSMGRMFYEPLWIFYKSDRTLTRLSDLKGLRITVGAEGSGTRVLTTELLRRSKVFTADATYLPLSGQAAANALLDGKADVAMLPLAAESPLLRTLLTNTSIKIMSLEQADAMARIFPYLAKLVLPKGAIDLDAQIPRDDVTLVAPVATVLVREELHPAIVGLLAQAAKDVHSGPGLFQNAGDFPLASDPDFPVSEDAERYYKNGRPFLQRYLPFWLANFIERMIVLLVPLATIAIPVVKGLPLLYRWRVQRKLQQWYVRLNKLEAEINRDDTGAFAERHLAEIERIDDGVLVMNVPRTFAAAYYDLRSHIEMVRLRLEAQST